MNKLFTKIAALSVGLAMAIGVGVAVGGKSYEKNAITAYADEGDTHDFAQNLQQQLNSNASIASITIPQQSYSVKKVTLSFRYNKSIENAVTVNVSVGSTNFGSFNVNVNTGTSYTTHDFTGTATEGAVTLSFTNNTGSGTGHGTFYVNNVTLTEGASSKTTTSITLSEDGPLSMEMGDVKNDLTATLSPSVPSATITWSSNATSVATVSSSGAITAVGRGTATITASYAGNSSYTSSYKTITVNVVTGDSDHPYSVAQAQTAISSLANNGTIENVYTTGIVVSVVEIQTEQYFNATYYISDDGTESGQLYVYRGKNLNNTNFTSIDDIKAGDTVVIYGTLKKYVAGNVTTPEINQGNYLTSLDRPASTDPTITITNESISGVIGSQVSLTYETTNTDSFSDLNVVWSLPENSIATVSGSTLTFVGTGSNTSVTATLYDGNEEKASTSKAISVLAPTIAITGTGVENNALKMDYNDSVVVSKSETNSPIDNVTYEWTASGSGFTFTQESLTLTSGSNDGSGSLTVNLKYKGTTVASNTINITVSETFKQNKGKYYLCKDVSKLVEGAHIAITNSDSTVVMSSFGSNNTRGATCSVNSTYNYLESESTIIDIEIEKSGSDFKLKVGDDSYLYACSSSANQLKAAAWDTAKNNNNGLWTITISESGVATIKSKASSNRPCMMQNDNSGTPLIACYAQKDFDDEKYNTLSIHLFKSYEEEALAYSELFIDGIGGRTCAETVALWDDLGDEFEKLTPGAQNLFKNATHNPDYTIYASNTDGTIENTVARYDCALIEHSELRSNEFMGRVAAGTLSFGSGKASIEITAQGNNAVTAIIVIASVTLLGVGGYFFIRKKKEQ